MPFQIRPVNYVSPAGAGSYPLWYGSDMDILSVSLLLLILLLGAKIAVLSGRVRRLEASVRRLQTAEPPVETGSPDSRKHADAPTPPTPPVKPPSRTRAEWEALLGGRVMNLIGAAALILGAGFFLKYAFDNNWLNEIMRVLIGGAAGLLLIGTGIRLHDRGLAIFAQGLIGAGIAILYLTVYAAFDFYSLISQPAAFGLMAGVTGGAFYLALRYHASAISFLAWAGGFLTPFLLNTGVVNTIGLFTYITLLNIGLVAVLLKKRDWDILELLTIGATYLTYAFWQDEVDITEHVFTASSFLMIWWGLFAGLDLSRIIYGSSGNLLMRRLIVAVNATGIFLATVSLMEAAYPDWTAAALLVFCLAYGGLMMITIGRTEDQRPAGAYAVTAMLLLIFATAIQFTEFSLVVAWSLEAAALFVAGVYAQRPFAWKGGLILFGLVALTLISLENGLWFERISLFTPVFNARTGAFWTLAGALLFCQPFSRRIDITSEQHRYHGLQIAGLVVLSIWTTVAVNDYFRLLMDAAAGNRLETLQNIRQLAISGMWLVDALIIMAFGIWQRIPAVRITAIIFFGCAVLKMFLYDLSFLDTLYRIISFLGLGVILMGVSYLYHRNRPA